MTTSHQSTGVTDTHIDTLVDMFEQTFGTDSTALRTRWSPAAAEVDDATLRSARIMVIDDEPVNARIIKKYLQNKGYENFHCQIDAMSAISHVNQWLPDVVLLDVVMPGVNGLEILRCLRANEMYRFLPIIIMTAHSSPDIKRDALQSGATDFLKKPIDPHELAPRVRNSLLVKMHQDRLARYAERLETTIEKRTKQLLAAQHDAQLRYVAGKAEIATDVLHNIGNTLNSVKSEVDQIHDALSDSKLDSLHRTASQLRDNLDCIDTFLRDDSQGKMIPVYLLELAECMARERHALIGDVRRVERHLQHIESVIATQRKYAQLGGAKEWIDLSELIHDAQELIDHSAAFDNIEIKHSPAAGPRVRTERLKLLQILRFLLENAVEAIQIATQVSRRIVSIDIDTSDPTKVRISVSDNGIGIPPEDLSQVFAPDFSTKQRGRGAGLHTCKQFVIELNGTIEASSDGHGKGATIVVTLPTDPDDSASEHRPS